MKPWSRVQVALAGLALIVVSNAVALLGVAWNRSGEPESLLTLTPRELRTDLSAWGRENSGVSLQLAWRVDTSKDSNWGWAYAGSGGTPPWLDEAKMASLGFAPEESQRPSRQLSKEVLLVLEMNGPAYAAFMQRVREQAAGSEAAIKANTSLGDEARTRELRALHERLTTEEQRGSRLFVVDAGLDVHALRQRCPDRGRYAIVRGNVQPWAFARSNTDKNPARGYIHGLSNDAIHVPKRWLGAVERDWGKPDAGTPLVRIAFGARLEPWLLDIAPAAK